MSKKKPVVHIFHTPVLAGAFDNGVTVVALCGKPKQLKSKHHDEVMQREDRKVCKGCQTVHALWVKNGTAAAGPIGTRTAAELNSPPTEAYYKIVPQGEWPYTDKKGPTSKFPLAG